MPANSPYFLNAPEFNRETATWSPVKLGYQPLSQGRGLESLTLDDFRPEYKGYNPVIGDYGQRAVNGPAVEWTYDVPEEYSIQALRAMSPGAVEGLLASIKKKRDAFDRELHGQRQDVGQLRVNDYLPNIDPGSQEGAAELQRLGWMPVGDGGGDDGGGGTWVPPELQAAYKQNQEIEAQRNRISRYFDSIKANVRQRLSEERQAQIQDRNRGMAAFATAADAAGVPLRKFDPLDFDRFARIGRGEENLPAFMRDYTRASQTAFTPEMLAKMGVGLPGYGQTGQQTNVVMPGGQVIRHDNSLLPPQQMPYNPVDPLSEAAYYGGQPNTYTPFPESFNVPGYDPPAMAIRTLDPNAPMDPDIADRLRNPDDWELLPPDGSGYEMARYRRKLRPYAEGDRIVRPAGDMRYGNLRPGFYTGGSVTGPESMGRLPGRMEQPIDDGYKPYQPPRYGSGADDGDMRRTGPSSYSPLASATRRVSGYSPTTTTASMSYGRYRPMAGGIA